MPVGMSSFFGGGSLGQAGVYTPSSSGGGGTSGAGLDDTIAPNLDAAVDEVKLIEKPVDVDPNKKSTGLSDITTGAALGATVGSVIPVVGTAVGGLVGGLLGAVGVLDLLGLGGPSDGEIMRSQRTATQNAYAYGQAAYDYVSESKTAADELYDTTLASERARLAGSGIEVDGSSQWDDVVGGALQVKNETYAALDQELADFRASDNFEWFRNDYDYLTRVRTTTGGTARNDTEWMTQEIGNDDHGRSNREVYDQEQYSLLRTNDNEALKDTYAEYAQRLAPGADAYEKASFGTEADKLQYKADMDVRVAEANTWYDREVQAYNIRVYNAGQVSTPNDEATGSKYFKEKDGTIVKKTDSEEYKRQQEKVDRSDQRG